MLAVHVAQVDEILRGFRKHLLGVDYDGLERFRRVYQIDGLWERLESEDVDALDYRCFASVGFGHGKRLKAEFSSGECRGERAADGPYAAVERQLAEEHALVELLAKKWPMQPTRPSAIGRSNAEPSLRTSAGARLMVTPWP